MASYTANQLFSSRRGTSVTAGGFYNEQSLPEEYLSASIPPHPGYRVLPEEAVFSTPPRSSGSHSGSSTALEVSNLALFSQSPNESFNMFERSRPMWPSDSQSVLTGQIPGSSDDFSLATFLFVPKTYQSAFDQKNCLLSNREMRTEAPSLLTNNTPGILYPEELHIESFPFGHSAQWGKVPAIDERRDVDAAFDILDLSQYLHEPTISSAADLPLSSADKSCTHMRVSSYGPGLGDLILHKGSLDLKHHGKSEDLAPCVHQDRQVFGDIPSGCCCSFAANRIFPDLSSLETASMSEWPRIAPGYRDLASKAPPPSAETIDEIGTHVAGSQEVKKGVRHGPLGLKTRRKASKVRARGACAPCRRSRLSCDPELSVCRNCEKKYARHTLEFRGCQWGPLKDYTMALIPALLTEGLSQWAVENWIKEKQVVFTAHATVIQVSSDPFGFKMSLPVHEIYSSNQDYLIVPDLSSESKSNRQHFATRPSLQYGMYNRPISYLKQSCTEYVESVSKFPMDAATEIGGETSPIVWKVLSALRRFAQTNPGVKTKGMLQVALNTFWMCYMMGRSLVLSEESAARAIEGLQNSAAVLPPGRFISAALVSRQIKATVMLLLEESIQVLLQGMEKELRNDSSSWPICFSTILVLCILVGQVDIATDAMVIHKTSCAGHDASDIRKKGIESSQAREKALNYAWEMYAGIQGKNNPIKDKCQINSGLSRSREEADFINEIRGLIDEHGIHSRKNHDAPLTRMLGDEISEGAAQSCLAGASEAPEDHHRYQTRSSAHYVCRFFKMFC